jgi:hypothetical protein
MNSDHGTEGAYSEREMSLILKRAAELDGREGAKSRALYTLAEIQEIAAGAGIDAATVSAAASELRRPGQSPSLLLGGPTRFRAERSALVAVPPTAFGELVDTIRLQTGLMGDSSQVFDSLEWRGRDLSGFVFVTVAPRDRETRVTVVAARADEAVLVGAAGFAAAVATAFVSVPLLMSAGASPATVSVASAVAVATAFVVTMRTMWRRRATRWTRRTTEIADAVARRLTEIAGTSEVR